MDDAKQIHSRIQYVKTTVASITHQEVLHYVSTEAVFEWWPELFQRSGGLLKARGIKHLGFLPSTEVEIIRTRGIPLQEDHETTASKKQTKPRQHPNKRRYAKNNRNLRTGKRRCETDNDGAQKQAEPQDEEKTAHKK